ncbi:hypothetical protein L1987_80139 [Smallanthus sonchifolius]|uniref:Uncharacterized protein n=1 Tax=Smallanthus sonchifolius TaxID=185202 RepID=A0ACB8YMI1_9ASTR|nr:hypothetical protein L1987_80139 [Smallanthus sonchifolius]
MVAPPQESLKKTLWLIGKRRKTFFLGHGLYLDLKQGCGVVGEIKIKHDRNAIKNVKFRLGAMVVGCPYEVKEAVTDPFQVKDRRNKPKTLRPLSPEDNVASLSNISGKGNGTIRKRLESENIRTVKKFTHMYFSNPQKLQEICGVKGKNWEKIVNHAKTSLMGNTQSNALASDDYDGSIEFDNDGYVPQSCEVEHLSIDPGFSIDDLPISDMYFNVFELGQVKEESGMNVVVALVGNSIEANGFTAKKRWMKMLFVSISIGTFAKKITLYVTDLIG